MAMDYLQLYNKSTMNTNITMYVGYNVTLWYVRLTTAARGKAVVHILSVRL
jgi:hypothetical protein